jgi:hypothetical protein
MLVHEKQVPNLILRPSAVQGKRVLVEQGPASASKVSRFSANRCFDAICVTMLLNLPAARLSRYFRFGQ